MKSALGALFVVVAIGAVSCGDDGPTAPAPSSSPSPTATPQPIVTAVRVSGNGVMTAIGETSRLTAVATYTDGSSRDVTTEATWRSLSAQLFSVSAGVVTVVAFGAGDIQASLQSRTGSLRLTATPPGTHIYWGRAREPGFSTLSGVRVFETGSNRSVVSDQNGFQLAAMPVAAMFKFEKDGYETTDVEPEEPRGPLVFVDGPLQRIVRMSAGQTLSLQIAPHDVSFSVPSELCYPCKLVRVSTPGPGTLRLTASWQGTKALYLWVNGTRFASSGSSISAETSVSGGELPVYIGWNLPLTSGGASSYTSFSVTAAMGGP